MVANFNLKLCGEEHSIMSYPVNSGSIVAMMVPVKVRDVEVFSEEYSEELSISSLNVLKHLVAMIGRLYDRAICWELDVLKAYFYGFLIGDGSYSSLSRTPIVSVETTHLGTLLSFIIPSLIIYKRVIIYSYSRRESFVRVKLRPYTYVERSSIRSLTSNVIGHVLSNYVENESLWYAFNAGLIDSDGTIVPCVKLRHRPRPVYYFEPEIDVINRNRKLLELLCRVWRRYNVIGFIRYHHNALHRYGIHNKGSIGIFLSKVMKYMFNIERLSKAQLVMKGLNVKYVPDDVMLLRETSDKINKHYQQLKTQLLRLAQELANKRLNILLCIK